MTDTPTEPETDTDDHSEESSRNVHRYLIWGAIGISLLVSVTAVFQLYFNLGQLIGIWIAPEYEPAFRAAFNLTVLLFAIYVAARLVDRLDVSLR